MQIARSKFQTWFANHRLNAYLYEVAGTLQRVGVVALQMPPSPSTGREGPVYRGPMFVSINEMFSGVPHAMLSDCPPTVSDTTILSRVTSNARSRLALLLEKLELMTRSNFERSHVKDLRASLQFFQTWDKQYRLVFDGSSMKSVLSQHWGLCQTHVQCTYELMLSAVADTDGATEDPFPEERRWR